VDHLQTVLCRIVQLSAPAMAAEIESHHPVIPAQSVKESAVDPVRPHAQDESTHQDDRVTLAANQIPDRDAIGIEFLRLSR
jgi:hypothetical protein